MSLQLFLVSCYFYSLLFRSPDNCPRGKLLPVRVRVCVKVSFRVGAIVLEPFFALASFLEFFSKSFALLFFFHCVYTLYRLSFFSLRIYFIPFVVFFIAYILNTVCHFLKIALFVYFFLLSIVFLFTALRSFLLSFFSCLLRQVKNWLSVQSVERRFNFGIKNHFVFFKQKIDRFLLLVTLSNCQVSINLV